MRKYRGEEDTGRKDGGGGAGGWNKQAEREKHGEKQDINKKQERRSYSRQY